MIVYDDYDDYIYIYSIEYLMGVFMVILIFIYFVNYVLWYYKIKIFKGMQMIVVIEWVQGMFKISLRNGEGGSRYYEVYLMCGIYQCSQIICMVRMISNYFLCLKDIGGMGDVVYLVIYFFVGQQIDV